MSRNTFAGSLLFCLGISWCLASLAGAEITAARPGLSKESVANLTPKEIQWRGLGELQTEYVGIASVQPWIRKVATVKVPGKENHWRHLLVKKASRPARDMIFVTIDLNSGELKEHKPQPGHEVLPQRWLDGKLYLGGNLPCHVFAYDPAADAIEDLGAAFDRGVTAFRLATGPDGTLAVGAGGSTEVSLYDPKTRSWTRFGDVGSKGQGYVYELSQDANFIYAATRGGDPWQLVVIDKKTKERRVIMTQPPDGYINISGNLASVREKPNGEWKRYELKDGHLVPLDPAAKAEPAPRPEPEPQVLLEDSPLNQGRPEILVHYQNPTNREEWRQVSVSVSPALENLEGAATLDDGRITAFGGPYMPIVIFDPKTGKGHQVPMPQVSARSILCLGNIVYVSGYPGAILMRYDPEKPVTNISALPGKPAVPEDDSKANPRRVGRTAMTATSGGHIGVQMFKGADGAIYLCTRRHRHHSGFDIARYDPVADKLEEIEDGGFLNHLQVGWCTLIESGKKLAVATYVQPNEQIPGNPPEVAPLVILDLERRAYTARYELLPGIKKLTGVAEVAPNKLVGMALDAEAKTTFVYKFDLAAGKVEQVVRYSGQIQGTPGTTGLPGKGGDFVLAPDGFIWTSIGVSAGLCAAVRINPTDLSVQPIGLVKRNAVRYLFHDGNVYLLGSERLQRVLGLAPGVGRKG